MYSIMTSATGLPVTASFSHRVLITLAKRSPSERPLVKPYARLFKPFIQSVTEPMQVIRHDQGKHIRAVGPVDKPEKQRWVEPGKPATPEGRAGRTGLAVAVIYGCQN